MTGRPRPRRVAPPELVAWERETDAVRAEYRARERQAAGSGAGFIAARTELLRQARKGGVLQSPSTTNGGPEDPQTGVPRAPARTRARVGSWMSSLGGGVS